MPLASFNEDSGDSTPETEPLADKYRWCYWYRMTSTCIHNDAEETVTKLQQQACYTTTVFHGVTVLQQTVTHCLFHSDRITSWLVRCEVKRENAVEQKLFIHSFNRYAEAALEH